MKETPRIKFIRAGQRLEIPPNPESISNRTEIYVNRYTGWAVYQFG